MKNMICVYDFETDGINPRTCQPVQIAACILNNITLEPIEGSEFMSWMRPEGIEDPAWAKEKARASTIKWHADNYGITPEAVLEQWKEAPSQKDVWSEFTSYLVKYNINKRNKTKGGAPIRAGMNVRNYDNIIVDRMCNLYGTADKDGGQNIFHPRDVIDIMELAFYWFESLPEPKKYNMGELRRFFGMSEHGSHDALNDVRDETAIIQRFIKLHRTKARKVVFKNALKPKKDAAVSTSPHLNTQG